MPLEADGLASTAIGMEEGDRAVLNGTVDIKSVRHSRGIQREILRRTGFIRNSILAVFEITEALVRVVKESLLYSMN